MDSLMEERERERAGKKKQRGKSLSLPLHLLSRAVAAADCQTAEVAEAAAADVWRAIQLRSDLQVAR